MIDGPETANHIGLLSKTFIIIARGGGDIIINVLLNRGYDLFLRWWGTGL
jgi:hypothetical protein